MSEREVLLADFQACTGIEDVGEAIFYLEEANWDLLTAVHSVMPQDTQTLPSEMDVDVEILGEVTKNEPVPASHVASVHKQPDVAAGSGSQMECGVPFQQPVVTSPDVVSLPSTSRSEDRMLQFVVHFMDEVVSLQIRDTGTVGDLKILLAGKLRIPTLQYDLQGWRRYPKNDMTKLSSLNLPKENTLFIGTSNHVEDEESSEELKLTERLTQSFTLNVEDVTKQNKYSLKFLGSKTVLEVKADIYTLTDIPVRHQLWSGWPPQLKSDRTTLASSGINHPIHELTVKRNPASATSLREKKVVVDIADSDNSSVEEFEDASETFTVEDDIFVDVETRKIQHLIPDNIDDEAAGCIHFAEQFAGRYGDSHPDFFLGTLEEAIREACSKPAKDRRLLAVYLHHDSSVLTNVFCTQLLCFESVLQCLAEHFVVWGWDLTQESNRLKFLGAVARTLGSMAAMTIRNIDVERLPALIVIMKMRSATEIYTVVHGNVGVSELLTSLIQSVDVFSDQQRLEVHEESERAARELVKREQDEAYQESLEADRAKEEAKKHQALMANQERERKESQKQELESIKETYRLEVESTLPDEPEEGAGDGVSKIRFRLPKGEFLFRRFYADTPLQILLNYLVVQGYPQDEFKVISSWPRRDLTAIDPNLTLQELKLYPQETVILEER